MQQENNSLVKVKICGLTSEADVRIIEKYGADYAGMVLYYPKSRRNIDITLAATFVEQLKKSDIKTVAVVVSPDVSQLEAIQNSGFDYIQIHGELSEDVYDGCNIDIIRAVNIKQQSDEDIYLETKRWRSLDKVKGLLFDAGVPGSGKTFDWNSLKKVDCGDKNLFLAGGLTPDNVRTAIEAVRPDVVDISSGVEYDDISVKGKDENKVKTFIQNAKY
ncbi:MAG: phosphoribosylanthranilate isomerase [Eubacteriales bacterium]|nr:phosphoribosylanthranilate isomerase [Eubacteriales bacterium]